MKGKKGLENKKGRKGKKDKKGLERRYVSVTGKKIYLQPRGTIQSAIWDLAELQKGRTTFSDIPKGKIHFLVQLYNKKWEYRFQIIDIGKGRSVVELEIGGDGRKAECVISREFSLLDSILIEGAKRELAEREALGRSRIVATEAFGGEISCV